MIKTIILKFSFSDVIFQRAIIFFSILVFFSEDATSTLLKILYKSKFSLQIDVDYQHFFERMKTPNIFLGKLQALKYYLFLVYFGIFEIFDLFWDIFFRKLKYRPLFAKVSKSDFRPLYMTLGTRPERTKDLLP